MRLKIAGMIRALYEASQAGVKIDLIIRGVCSLTARGAGGQRNHYAFAASSAVFWSTVAFYYFPMAARSLIYVGSADFMPRNLNRRVEILFPVEEARLVRRIRDRILAKYLEDEAGSCFMNSTGSYARPERQPGKRLFSSQSYFLRKPES